ncbi:MAG TPA: YHS domain-containing protein, partial [Chthoniobacterales bacterium]
MNDSKSNKSTPPSNLKLLNYIKERTSFVEIRKSGQINMNAVPEVNSLDANPHGKYPVWERPNRCPWQALKRGLLVCALSLATAYQSNADPKSGMAIGAGNGLEVDHIGARVWLEKGAHKLNLDSHGVILKGYDPVAYFSQKKAVKGTPKYKTNYQGATYYFSSTANLTTFERNPSKYAP